jgi:hypothetical protein
LAALAAAGVLSTREAEARSGTGARLGELWQLPVRWCVLSGAPILNSTNFPNLGEPSTTDILWRRHERASEGTLIPDVNVNLRSARIAREIADPNDTGAFAGFPTIIAPDGNANVVGATEAAALRQLCVTAWENKLSNDAGGLPPNNDFGVIAISADQVFLTGNQQVRGLADPGAKWVVVQDPVYHWPFVGLPHLVVNNATAPSDAFEKILAEGIIRALPTQSARLCDATATDTIDVSGTVFGPGIRFLDGFGITSVGDASLPIFGGQAATRGRGWTPINACSPAQNAATVRDANVFLSDIAGNVIPAQECLAQMAFLFNAPQVDNDCRGNFMLQVNGAITFHQDVQDIATGVCSNQTCVPDQALLVRAQVQRDVGCVTENGEAACGGTAACTGGPPGVPALSNGCASLMLQAPAPAQTPDPDVVEAPSTVRGFRDGFPDPLGDVSEAVVDMAVVFATQTPESRTSYTHDLKGTVDCSTIDAFEKVEYFAFADLDNLATTGGTPSSLGIPSTFQGAELVTRVEARANRDHSRHGRGRCRSVSAIPTVWRFQSGAFVRITNSAIVANIIPHTLVGTSVSGSTLTERAFDGVEIELPDDVRGPVAERHRVDALTRAVRRSVFHRPGATIIDRLTNDQTGRPSDWVAPQFPGCSVSPDEASPGGRILIDVFRMPRNQPIEAYIPGVNEEILETTDSEGLASFFVNLPEDFLPGTHLVTVGTRNPDGGATGITADCAVTVPDPCRVDDVTVTVCDVGKQRVLLTNPNPACEGEVIRESGFPINPPLPIDDGDVNLVPGVYTVRWTDGSIGTEQIVRVVGSESAEHCCSPHQIAIVGTEDNDRIHPRNEHRSYCVTGLGGSDHVQTHRGGDTLLGGGGFDTLLTGSGNDRVLGGIDGDSIAAVLGNAGWGWNTGGSFVVNGGAGNDYITAKDKNSSEMYGGLGNDNLAGGRGVDVLVPGSGKDRVTGGAGNDRVEINATCELAAGEFLDGGSGTDTLVTPLAVADLRALGVIVTNSFENVVIDTNRAYLADCP